MCAGHGIKYILKLICVHFFSKASISTHSREKTTPSYYIIFESFMLSGENKTRVAWRLGNHLAGVAQIMYVDHPLIPNTFGL